MTKHRGRLYFALMSVVFRVRDLIWPPDRTLREVGVLPGHTLLDFGCGPGGYSIAAARLVGPSGRVYALDINPLAIRAVQRAAEKKNLGNVTTILADNPAGLPIHSIDAALMHDVLHELENPFGVVTGLDRALRQGGLLAVSDHHMREASIISAISSGGLFGLSRSFKGMHCFKRSQAEARQ